jgi:hypothetical protein
MSESTGLKTKFKIDSTTVGQVAAITPPSPARDTVDVDDLNPTDDVKKKLVGLIDLGESSLTLNFARGATGHTTLESALYAGTTKSFEIEFPGGDKLGYSGLVTGFAIQEITAGDVIQAEVTIAVTTKPTWS